MKKSNYVAHMMMLLLLLGISATLCYGQTARKNPYITLSLDATTL